MGSAKDDNRLASASEPSPSSENPRDDRAVEDVVERQVEIWEQEYLRQNPQGLGAFLTTPRDKANLRQALREVEAAKRGLPLPPRPALVHQATSAETAALLSERLTKWQPKSFQDAMKASAQKPRAVVDALVLEQSPTLVSALPHAVKSLSWHQASIEAVAKKIIWGHFVAPNVEKTLFVETEDPSWLVEGRTRLIARGLDLEEDDPLPGFHYVCPGPFDLVKEATELEQLILKCGPDFVVLSTMQNVLGGRNIKEPDEMQDVIAVIIRLSRAYCPVVVITHSPWDKTQRRAAGTVTLTANFPTTLHYEKSESKDETTVHVLVDSKVGARSNFYLDLIVEPDPLEEGPRSVHLVYGGQGRPKGSGKDAIQAAIEEDPGASTKEVAERVGVSERYVRNVKRNVAPLKKKARKKPQKQPEAPK